MIKKTIQKIPQKGFTLGALSILGVTLILSLLDPKGEPLSGFFAYLVIAILCGVLFWISWRSVRKINPPRWLFWAVSVALALRLIVGVGLYLGLPTFGYPDSTPHQAGYIFLDAYSRDTDAWNLARSEEPLTSAWQDSELNDQYGGLLFMSAAVYRGLSPEIRRPILVLLLSATIGSLAVFFTWSFTNQRLGIKAAAIASWVVALYPEAVFLGASHMREPFLITALALSLTGYVQWRAEQRRSGIYFILAGIGLTLLVSPPYMIILLAVLLGAWLWEGRGEGERKAFIISAVVLLGMIALLLTLRAWSRIEGRPDGSAIELILWWLTSGAEYQLQVLQAESGWVAKIFGQVPEWAQMPLATFYGLLQPFFPAAVMDSTSAPLIRIIVSLRGMGWFFLLPFLICAPFIAIRQSGWRSLPTYLVFLIWITAILVSYRDAGRQWDNPRWRTVFLCAQAAMVGWTWITFKRIESPWLLRVGVVVVFSTVAFIFWEAGRYYHIPRFNLWETLGIIGGFTALFFGVSYFRDRQKSKQLNP
jgi:hypothetical protein